MGDEEFYFQFFENVLTFEEIFEDVVTRDRQYFSLHYACFGVEPLSEVLAFLLWFVVSFLYVDVVFLVFCFCLFLSYFS